MSSNVQHEDAWSMHVSSVCSQGIDKEDDTSKLEASKACAVHRDTSLTEHDYIGLSATSSVSTSTTQTIFHNLMHLDSSKCSDARDKEPECRDTELRLGIGPYIGDASMLQHGGQLGQSMPRQHLFPQNQILKQAVDGSNAQYWCHEGESGNGSVEFHQSFWPWGPGVAPGRFMIPVPKVSMVPAKRPYVEVMGENNKASICTLATNFNTPSEAVPLERTNHVSSSTAPLLPALASSSQGGGGGGFYAWSCSTSMPPMVARAAWQHGNSDQDGMVGATLTKSCPVRALPPPPIFKPSPAPPVSQYDPLPPMMSKSPVAPHLSSSSEERASLTSDAHKEGGSRNKAPVVGWPPVRSFRKNTLQSAAGLGASKGIGASSDLRQHEDASKANESVADKQIKGSTKDALFVKAKLDGVRICRKVDLTSYSSYDSLKSALQEMFQGFVCSDNSKLDLLHGKNYVLTHEDKDGDWMLVGDVPWRMFVTTVKSLRIMKAVDAVGLGEKVFAKLKAEDMKCKAQ